MKTATRLEEQLEHRPWPLPDTPWVMFQSWRNLLFAHWRVSSGALRPLVPAELELDEHDGTAWVTLAPFWLADLHIRFMPPIPGVASFPELNLRTYVRDGNKPGVYFFSLDAGSRFAVASARALYRLPYHNAEMSVERDGQGFHYRSRRGDGRAELDCRYRPTGLVFEAQPGTLEHFLVERYALYTVVGEGKVMRAEIHHGPWPLQPAEAELATNTVAQAAGFTLPATPPLLHFSRRQDTLIWLPEVAR